MSKQIFYVCLCNFKSKKKKEEERERTNLGKLSQALSAQLEALYSPRPRL